MTHGAGLAAIWGSWARYVMDKHLKRFVKYAVNVMGVTLDFLDDRATALQGRFCCFTVVSGMTHSGLLRASTTSSRRGALDLVVW